MFDIEIEKIIPHRDRLKLLDEIVFVDDKKAVTASIVSERWPLFRGNSVDPIILIELIAQTTGIAAGYDKYKETGKGVYGWIVGIKYINFYTGEIPVGTRLINTVKPLYEHESYAVFSGTVSSFESGENELPEKKLCDMEIQLFSPK